MPTIQCLKAGTKNFGSGESWVDFWVFPADITDSQLTDFLESNDIYSAQSGPGSFYARRPIIRRSYSLCLVTQSAGYDV